MMCDTGANGRQEASCMCCLVQDFYIFQMTSHPLHGPENGGGGAPQWWDRVTHVWDTVCGWFLLLGLPSDWFCWGSLSSVEPTRDSASRL
jgi:hypothetical protein